MKPDMQQAYNDVVQTHQSICGDLNQLLIDAERRITTKEDLVAAIRHLASRTITRTHRSSCQLYRALNPVQPIAQCCAAGNCTEEIAVDISCYGGDETVMLYVDRQTGRSRRVVEGFR